MPDDCWRSVTIIAQALIASLTGTLGLAVVIRYAALLGIPSAILFGLFIDDTSLIFSQRRQKRRRGHRLAQGAEARSPNPYAIYAKMTRARLYPCGWFYCIFALQIVSWSGSYASPSIHDNQPAAQPSIAVKAGVLLTGGIGMVHAPTGESPAVLDWAEIFNTNKRLFLPVGQMTTRRNRHTAVLMPDGQVLILGGVDAVLIPMIPFFGPAMPWVLSSTEVFDPVAGRFGVSASMHAARDEPTATLLSNGKVLIVGGGIDAAELYDSTTESFSRIGTNSVFSSRYEHTATLLRSGKVLLAGGGDAQAALFEPSDNQFITTGAMSSNRVYDTATLLADGKVLIAGGCPYAHGPAFSSSEIYDPGSGKFTLGPAMIEARAGHAATLLDDGRVLITGGSSDNLAEIYDPEVNAFYPAAMMSDSRRGHSATVLPDGQVLIAGGLDQSYKPLTTAQLYDPASGQFLPPIEMTEARAGQTATLVWIRWPFAIATLSPTPFPTTAPAVTPMPPAHAAPVPTTRELGASAPVSAAPETRPKQP